MHRLDELRAIADYPNQRKLLDTSEVHDLVRNENVQFVDMRYPGEFATGHLPGAVNIPMRRMSTAAIEEKIAGLPRRPIVVPCYDRRSCFFGEVIGLELTRAGHDFRGRYTVPWEYFIPSGRPPHVEAWIAESRRGLWDKALDRTTVALGGAAQHTGFPLAIFLLAMLSRLLVLPLSLKAERDQIISRRVAGELDALKARLAEDPVRRMRAIQGFYRRHGLTPGRNLLALLFLPIMTLAVASVQRLSGDMPQALWWMDGLDTRDETLLLPLVFGVLIALYLHVSLAETRRQRILCWTLGLGLMTAAAALLGAAADLYLIASAGLLLVQRFIVAGGLRRLVAPVGLIRRLWLYRGLPAGVVPLSDPPGLAGAGNKAYRLARLSGEGIDVPPGVVLTARFLERYAEFPERRRKRTLDRLWRSLGRQPLAVRSSASAEDGTTQSFAGVFDSELDVDRERLEAAIGRVAASFSAERAASYDMSPGAGNIILQQMVSAGYAGVLFTRDPQSPASVLLEMVEGGGEKLVSGRAAPASYRFGRHTRVELPGQTAPPIDVAPLLLIGQRAEALFGAPQDIEWTWTDRGFHIVQSRDITSVMTSGEDAGGREADWDRVLVRAAQTALYASTEAVLFQQNELSEQLPLPTTLSLSLMEAMWKSGGSVDLACRRLRLDYRVEEDAPSYLTTIAGRLYVDKSEAQRRAPTVSRRKLAKLVRSAPEIERGFRETFLRTFLERVALLEAIDFERMPTALLADRIRKLIDSFVHDTHVDVDVINIVAGAVVAHATGKLTALGIDAAHALSGAPQTEVASGLAAVASADPADRLEALRSLVGHRAAFDYELSEPRYGESETALAALIPGGGHALARTRTPLPLPPEVEALVRTARGLETLKEDAKHHCLRELAVLRRALLALDQRLGWDGLVFELSIDELSVLTPASADRHHRAASLRRRMRELWMRERPPQASLTLRELELAAAGGMPAEVGTGDLKGIRVAGSRRSSGRAVHVADADAECGAEIAGFAAGDIIVARMLHPAWLPYLRTAGGIVTELGGWLSHMALLARELDVAMIVGVRDLSAIPSGRSVTLETDGRITIVEIEPAGNVIAGSKTDRAAA